MKIIIILSTFLIINQLSFGAENKTISRWNTLYQLVQLEIKTIKNQKSKDPTILYRLLELNSEKIKLLKEKENETFLMASPVSIREKGKASFYKKSKDLERETRKLGLFLIRKHPSFRFRGRVFYTLGLNSLEYGNGKYVRPYLYQALKALGPTSPIRHNVRTVLAEYFYNEKNYVKANKFYSLVIKKKSDKWHSKHLYNSSWCLYKIDKVDESISRIKQSYKISNQAEYVNISDQILNSMAVIFSSTNRVEEGTDFFINNLKNHLTYLFKMVDYLAGHGNQKKSEYVLNRAWHHSNKNQKSLDLLKIQTKKLEIFKKFTQYEKFHNASIGIKDLWLKYKFKAEVMIPTIKLIKDHTGYLQVVLMGKKNRKHLPSILSFLKILSIIDIQNIAKYEYFKGETFYGIESFGKSIKSYTKALILLKKQKPGDLTLSTKVLNALLANLDKIKGHKNYSKYALFTFVNFIKILPKNKKSKYIFSRLFNLYYKKKNIKRSITTFNLFFKNFPKEVPALKKQLMSIIEYYIKNKNGKELALWVRKMEEGLLNLEKNFINKTIIVLGNILFFELERMELSNKKNKAIVGYELIFNDERYPNKIKGEAALKVGILLIKMGKAKDSSKWLTHSLATFPKEELFRKRSQYASIIHNLAYIQDFTTPNTISVNFLKNFCHRNFKEKKGLYSSLISHSLINSKPKSALSFHSRFKKCIKNKNILIKEKNLILSHLLKYDNKLLLTLLETEVDKKQPSPFTLTLINDFYLKSSRERKKGISNRLHRLIESNSKLASHFKNSDFYLATLKNKKLVKKILKENLFIIKSRRPIGPLFEENKFSAYIEKNLSLLKDLTLKSDSLKKLSSFKDHLELNEGLVKNYDSFSTYLSKLTFKNLSKGDNSAIRKITVKINSNLNKISRKFRKENKKIIEEYNLSHRVAKINPFKGYSKDLNWIYPSSRLSITMDLKGGLK